MNIQLRPETPADYRLVEYLTREAFWDVYKPGCEEHLVLHQLRNSRAFIPELDYVAVQNGEIIGSIVYSKARIIDDNSRSYEVLSMGPLSVLPSEQRKGVGSKLLIHTLTLAEQLNYRGVVIFGDPKFYHRFGFKPAAQFGIRPSLGDPFDAFMAKELGVDGLKNIHGTFIEDNAFHCNKETLEEFEKQFPFKEKHILDTQLFKE